MAVSPLDGRGTSRTKKSPVITGIAVPSPSTSKKPDVLPGKRMCEMEEKKNAERPKPDMTKLTAMARWMNVRAR